MPSIVSFDLPYLAGLHKSGIGTNRRKLQGGYNIDQVYLLRLDIDVEMAHKSNGE